MRAVRIAFLVGVIHAAFSLYWALGGTWLLDTVGQRPQDFVKSGPLSASLVLGLIALFKALAAVIPLLNAQGRLPWPKLWRGISWVGGVFLVLYGGFVTLTSLAVLGGLVNFGAYDRPAMLGHAFLWDPLFLMWGVALVWHLWQTRRNA
ncbi:DUF3995 domain-containing protein [Deinococcus fonticola]|uniref:DUF3995 domain-containing protein n=1 Tax=Deinococcus fonticola TaxID=2528713 RepID=UPI0010757F68|nr:DUF3995 domain-containing protein [Deinococcus fonticola]